MNPVEHVLGNTIFLLLFWPYEKNLYIELKKYYSNEFIKHIDTKLISFSVWFEEFILSYFTLSYWCYEVAFVQIRENCIYRPHVYEELPPTLANIGVKQDQAPTSCNDRHKIKSGLSARSYHLPGCKSTALCGQVINRTELKHGSDSTAL